MATQENKKFVYAVTKAKFMPQASNFDNCIVFIADTKEIYTHGAFYGLSVEDAAEIAKIASHGTRLTAVEEELAKKIKSVTADANSALSATTTDYETVISLKIANGESAGNVTLTQTSSGLSASVDIPEAAVTGVNANDKVLDLDGTELTATINLTYGDDPDNNNAKTIFLRGKDSEIISKVDATDFVRDKVVSDAVLVTTAEPGITIEVPYIKMTFNDESNPIRFSVKSLVDVYTGANVKLSSAYKTATTYAAPAIGDSVDTAIGKLTKGVADAKASGVTKFASQTGEITVDTTTTTNGAVKFAMSSKKLTATVNGLKSAAYTESSAYATAAQGEKADSALQSISNGTDGDYVTTIISNKSSNSQSVSVAVTVQAISSASSSSKGLLEASDAKTYIDTQISNVNSSLDWVNLE